MIKYAHINAIKLLILNTLKHQLCSVRFAGQYVERYWKSGQRELFDALTHQAVHTIEETINTLEGWLQRNTPS